MIIKKNLTMQEREKYLTKNTLTYQTSKKTINTLTRNKRNILVVGDSHSEDIFAGLKNIIGGEIQEYTKLQAVSREQAMQRMEDDANNMGADAIINVRLTTSMIMQGTAEILAYGTAVKLK